MGGRSELVKKFVQAVGLHAVVWCKGISTFEFVHACQPMVDVRAIGFLSFFRGLGGMILVDCCGQSCHGRQVIGLVDLLHVGRKSAAHDEPHNHFRAFPTAAVGIVGD